MNLNVVYQIISLFRVVHFLMGMTIHINMEFLTSLNVIRRNLIVPNIVYTFNASDKHSLYGGSNQDGYLPLEGADGGGLMVDENGHEVNVIIYTNEPTWWYFLCHSVVMTLSILIMSALFVKHSMCLNIIAIMLVFYAFWPK